MFGGVFERHRHHGTRLWSRLAGTEEQWPLVDGANVSVRLLNEHSPLVSVERDSAGGREVVVESLTLDVGHAPGRIHRALDPHGRHVRRDIPGVAVGENKIVLVTAVLQDLVKGDANPHSV